MRRIDPDACRGGPRAPGKRHARLRLADAWSPVLLLRINRAAWPGQHLRSGSTERTNTATALALPVSETCLA